jgi:trimeric autotransporter adhesin
VAISGTTVAVGEAFGAGAVHVFELSGTAWVRTAILRPVLDSFPRRFGHSVALSGDTLVVGDVGDASASTGVGGDPTNSDAPFSGAVYVYVRGEAGWTLEAYIKPSNTEEQDIFGASVALSGNTLAVSSSDASSATGVHGDPLNNDSPDAGSVFIFERGPGGWAQQAYLKASNTDARDFFGSALELSGDTLVIGASGEDSGASGVDGDQSSNSIESSGAVYVFRRAGASWAQEAYVKASNPGPFDLFGSDVALSGARLAVSAVREGSAAVGIDGDQSSDAATAAGAVYTFERSAASWAQTHYIKATNTDPDDFFGSGLAWAGELLLVGAEGEDSCAIRSNGDQFDDRCFFTGAMYVLQ